jgi:hypothetical protein
MTISTQSFIAINVGTTANDGTGDDLRTAFIKVNDNFQYMGNTGFNAGNIAATGVTATSLSVSNGLTNAGAQIETGYQQSKPTANVAITVNTNINRVLLHPTGTIVSFGANVTLPNVEVDGTIVSISSNVTIASLAVIPNWNGVVTVSPFGNTANVTAGTVSRYMYIAADKVWYKVA